MNNAKLPTVNLQGKVLGEDHKKNIGRGMVSYHDNKGRKGTVLKNGYRMIGIKGDRKYEHRMVWEDANGEIPDGYVIHHKNRNKLDNRLSNLEIMVAREHSGMHSKGRVDTDETCIKRSKIARKAKISDLEINLLRKSGLTLSSIGKLAGVTESCIWYRLKRFTHFPNKTWIQ